MPDNSPIVQIEHLSHRYGERLALDDVTLAISTGEIFGFLGPNGSGKTTLFRILSTLVRAQTPAPSSPSTQHSVLSTSLDSTCPVKLLGKDINLYRDEIRRHIGVVFQSPSLDKQLTAEENLRHHGHLYGLRGEELSRRIDGLLDRVGLSDRRNEYVKKFSGGMRRRVELAKGLLNRPSILLLDEPSTGLDLGARIDLWHYLREIQSRDGVTILLTTHLMDEADRCNRLAILDQGKLTACDTPTALKERIGGDVITMTTQNPAVVKAALHAKFGIDAEQFDGTLRLERQRGHEFIPQLIEALPGQIDSISVGKPTLEDVFIHVTGHVFRDGEG